MSEAALRPFRYDRFGLTLMLNHACNMRCSYCYNGAAFHRSMPEATAHRAIGRAVASCAPGGRLDIGFFGGEPAMEAALALRLIDHARDLCDRNRLELAVCLTTNGTITHGDAWTLMTLPTVDLSVSCDGLPEAHDAHRRFAAGGGTSGAVLATIDRLKEANKPFRTVLVVRPDTLSLLPEGVEFLCRRGVTHIDPTLDLWTLWTREDMSRLACALAGCADFWGRNLPEFGFSWFDEKAAHILGVPMDRCARCSFGAGEVAVSPSGALYPCERLIGSDDPAHPLRLPGSVEDGDDFLGLPSFPQRALEVCATCAIHDLCSTSCRCSNYARTGDVRRPDGLLCHLNRICLRETGRVLSALKLRLTEATSADTQRTDPVIFRRECHGDGWGSKSQGRSRSASGDVTSRSRLNAAT